MNQPLVKFAINTSFNNLIEKFVCKGVNSLVPGRLLWKFIPVILKIILMSDDWGISPKIALRWKSLALTDDKPTMIKLIACAARQLAVTGAFIDPVKYRD